jgi:hypothetical protein
VKALHKVLGNGRQHVGGNGYWFCSDTGNMLQATLHEPKNNFICRALTCAVKELHLVNAVRTPRVLVPY